MLGRLEAIDAALDVEKPEGWWRNQNENPDLNRRIQGHVLDPLDVCGAVVALFRYKRSGTNNREIRSEFLYFSDMLGRLEAIDAALDVENPDHIGDEPEMKDLRDEAVVAFLAYCKTFSQRVPKSKYVSFTTTASSRLVLPRRRM
jgi:hypothetical protein